jgi:glycosyltransferase involved in cell wall biosynthesis
VDDCSSDGTGEVARCAGATVLRNEFNRGYGASLKRGMNHASRAYIAWFDADNEHRADNLKEMVSLLHESSLAAIIGRRKIRGSNALRIFGKWAIGFVARALSVRLGPDINCGLRVFRKSAIMPYINVLPDRFSASVTSTMILVERGYMFEFHTIDLNPRVGKSKVKVAHGFEALVLVLRVVTLFAPLRIFVRGGLLSFLAGFIYGLAKAITVGQGVPPAAILLMLSGVILGMLGLIADQISQIRLNQLSD